MRKLLSIIAGAALGLATTANAAPIVWSAPVAITTADQALFGASQIQYAVDWGAGAQSVTVSSGTVNFTSGTIDGTGTIQVTGAAGIAGAGTAAYSGTSNSAFNTAISGFAYDGVQTVKLTGLTVGQTYSVQLFSLDNRGCCAARSQTFSDQNGNTSASYLHSADDYIIGTFTADAATETFTAAGQVVNGCSGTQACTNLNAAVLRTATSAVPEPATWGLMLIGFGGIGAAMRRKRGTSLSFG